MYVIQDIVWPPEHQHDRDSNVDIVFVHGLGGKRHRTWMKNDVFWPVDLLAKDFPQARIMTVRIYSVNTILIGFLNSSHHSLVSNINEGIL